MGERSGKPVDERTSGRVRLDLKPFGILLASALVLVASFTAVGSLIDGPLDEVVTDDLDVPVVGFFEDLRAPATNDIVRALTLLGGTPFVALVLGASAVWAYLVTRGIRWPAFFAAVAVGGLQLSGIVKILVGRPRPELALYEVHSAAFPSGHATAAAACYLAIAFFATRVRGLDPRLAWAAGIGLALVVGWTRIYLGVHWPSDVLFGWLLGVIWVAVAAYATGLRRQREPA